MTKKSKRITDFRGFCEYFGIKPSKGRSMIFRGEIKPIRLGRLLRFDLDYLDKYLEEKMGGKK